MNNLLLRTTALAVLAVLSADAVAAEASADAKYVAPEVVNPYSPAYRHHYRHGVIPTRKVSAQMKAWENAHTDTSHPRTLAYGGGTEGVGVMSGPVKVYLVFYGKQWGTSSKDGNGNLQFTTDPSGAASAAQQMFKGIGTNNEGWQADLTQWCDGTGVAAGATVCPSSGVNWVPYQQNVLAGVWYDNTKNSPTAATGTQLANEAISAAKHFGNTAAGSNRYTYYVILSPHGTNPDQYQGNYCAWHDYTGDQGVNSPYGEIAFSNQPYNTDSGEGCGVGFVNTPGTTDGYTMTLGHEWHEMMSDTYPAGGWTNQTTTSYSGQENSDECAWIDPGALGGAANVAFSTGSFAEQASWSNDTASCSISHAILTHGQILANTGFESSGSWAASAGVLCTNGTCSTETAHAGSGFALLDGLGVATTHTLSQTVTIPSGHTKANLKYYLHIDTAETTTTDKNDKLAVAVYNGATLLKTLHYFTNLNAAAGYTVQNSDLSAYIGQTVTLTFTGTENGSLQTSFVLDDVTLTVQ